MLKSGWKNLDCHRVTAWKSLTFQMTIMVETLQLEDMGKPPLDALFCILCRGTILFPNVKWIFPNHHFQFGRKHSSVFLRKQHFFVSRNWQKNNYCLNVSLIFQEDTAKYQRHLHLEHGVFYNRFGELMINFDDDDKRSWLWILWI